jgi:2-pyrone-4,6-dicarboxylate lactonase
LASTRTFDPPEAPIEALESVWQACGVSRAVLVQGSAHGFDHRAMLHGVSRDPENRRGIAVVSSSITHAELAELHCAGVRGIRFNWVRHLLRKYNQSSASALSEAASLASHVLPFGWHIEVHVDPEELGMIESLEVSSGQIVVIDHMARLDGSLGLIQPAFDRLIALLERKNVWVKLSGPDRLVRQEESLSAAKVFVSYLAQHVPDRSLWGLDWPHVNLNRTYSDLSLRAFVDEAIPDVDLRMKVLSENPARLYGFAPTGESQIKSNKPAQGVFKA